MSGRIDVLMITYNRPEAVRRSLPRLLETCTDDTRVWLWHNGNHQETLDLVRGFAGRPQVARFHHSPVNEKLRAPTNWLWHNSDAQYVSKVDDDCLVSPGWLETLRLAHESWDGFGVIGSWRHYPDEFLPDVGGRKLFTAPGGHQVMRNHWVQGSGYLARRSDVEAIGGLGPQDSFTDWCLRLAKAGKVNGFYHPFIFEDHMDDPRSANTLLRTDEDLLDNLPLTAQRNDVRSLAEWAARNRRAARLLQEAPLDLKHYYGWRPKARRLRGRARGLVTGRKQLW